jgi:hypothetical protein
MIERAAARRKGEQLPTASRDEGTVLVFVMVLIVVAGLMVMPLMSYTATVLRANRVVSDQTKQAEAAKGGLRVVLSDPKRIFTDCNNSTTLATTTINGYDVTSTCTEEEEVGPAIAQDFEVPVGAVAAQVGHEVRDSFSGGTLDSGPVPPYPATADWWSGQETILPENDKLWMPSLPDWPAATRSSTPLQMPSGFDCQVFLPGSYAAPLDLAGGDYYFASGVYYFADAVTVRGDANVVVGYGLSDLGTDCADDLQVAANVIGDIGTGFGISGGGATWVFGERGRLVVDDSLGGTPSLVFNQRYDSIDRGGRINIMTVNGDERTGLEHDVPDVNLIPRSSVVIGVDETDPSVPVPITGAITPATYAESSIEFTDAARPPLTPQGVTVEPYSYDDGSTLRGSIVVAWDEVTVQSTGGAVIDRYHVDLSPGPSSVCDPTDVMSTPGATGADPVRFTCAISGLGFDTYTVGVRAENFQGDSLASISTVSVTTLSPLVGPPDAPTDVVAVDGVAGNVAQIGWSPATSATPVTGYRVDATEISVVPHPNEPPVTPLSVSESEAVQLNPDSAVTAQIRAYDPNGDPLTLVITPPPLPADITVTADDDTDTITVQASAAAPPDTYLIPYTVTDPSGVAVGGELQVDLVAGPLVAQAPVADVLRLFADVGSPIAARVPVSDIDGVPFAVVPVTVDTAATTPTAAFDPTRWTVVVDGLDVTITTTAPDGTYSIPYTVTGSFGSPTSSFIEVTVARTYTTVGSCNVSASPGTPLATACEIPLLPDLPAVDPTFGLGYRFDVVATNAIGDSVPGMSAAPHPTAFEGTGTALVAPLPLQRDVVPWVPDPVIEILATDAGTTTVEVPGYVAVPMGRITVDNPNGDPVSLSGGVLTGTFDVVDGREVAGVDDTVPIGFRNDIVLQRKVRIISTAGTSQSIAIVQVNEDGAAYAVNDWSVS